MVAPYTPLMNRTNEWFPDSLASRRSAATCPGLAVATGRGDAGWTPYARHGSPADVVVPGAILKSGVTAPRPAPRGGPGRRNVDGRAPACRRSSGARRAAY